MIDGDLTWADPDEITILLVEVVKDLITLGVVACKCLNFPPGGKTSPEGAWEASSRMQK